MNKVLIVSSAAALILMTTNMSHAGTYLFTAHDGKNVVQVKTPNCSGNWARTNGAARRFEKANPATFTRLKKATPLQTCNSMKLEIIQPRKR